MKLYAISDLHLACTSNRQALEALPPQPEDWLILGGDIGETEEQLRFALATLSRRFAQLLWVPGNHDLWTMPSDGPSLRGDAKYRRLVAACREYGVLTPEDPYVTWPGSPRPYVLAPIFTLYDYSFRPDDVPLDQAVAWAEETGVVCSDEFVLHPDPYASRAEWCAARCDYTERRLAQVPKSAALIVIGHFPLRRDLVRLSKIPRFSIWCGTHRTEDWHMRFPISTVIYGHLHVRATDYRDGVRYEEVSLGYPRNWEFDRGMRSYLREILPGPPQPYPEYADPVWRW
ncbi:MAG TPA: metallophosphoesterase [Herpetosiphonaceae bacterium]